MKLRTVFVIAALVVMMVIVLPVAAAVSQDFVAENVHGIAPLTVSFTAVSNVTNVTGCQWGYVRVQPPASTWVSFSPDQRNTTFTFDDPGTYYIMFTEFTPDYPSGYISTTKANLVVVFPAPTPTPTPVPTVIPTPSPTPIPIIKKVGVGIFRPATGNWYLDTNGNGIYDITVHFGTTGDIPMPGDYNGDGLTDLAVFRPSSGYWYFDYNRDGTVDNSFRYGGSTDIPISGIW
jgi:hypothetical protein